MPFEPDPRIAEALARVPRIGAPTEVWKHTFVGQKPTAANKRGARWNPPGVPALYLATERDTAIAEGRFLVSRQPQPIKRGRTIHHLGIAGLGDVLDLRDRRVLRRLGVGAKELASPDFAACQRVGGSAGALGYAGMLVPSARSRGFNLVIFEGNAGEGLSFVPLDVAPLDLP